MLIKVPLKNGTEKWILLHIEVQGYQDKDLPRRMFTYYYRSLDRFGVPVEALVIFTDSNKRYRPSVYKYDGIRTNCKYEYPIFKLADFEMAIEMTCLSSLGDNTPPLMSILCNLFLFDRTIFMVY